MMRRKPCGYFRSWLRLHVLPLAATADTGMLTSEWPGACIGQPRQNALMTSFSMVNSQTFYNVKVYCRGSAVLGFHQTSLLRGVSAVPKQGSCSPTWSRRRSGDQHCSIARTGSISAGEATANPIHRSLVPTPAPCGCPTGPGSAPHPACCHKGTTQTTTYSLLKQTSNKMKQE